MKAVESVSVEQYLRAAYHPDCDYVDGEVLERNVGERDHSKVQRELVFFFRSRQQQWKTFVFPEQRLQVSPTRFRVPDVCVYLDEEPREQVFRTPPFICIEILSPEDRLDRVQERIDDYLDFGVPHVWVFNPRNRRAWIYTKQGSREVLEGVLRIDASPLEVPLTEIFAGLE